MKTTVTYKNENVIWSSHVCQH